MTILVTGVAGFIGSHVAMALLERGETVLGVDSINDYYDVALKEARLSRLLEHEGFEFVKKNLADPDLSEVLKPYQGVNRIVHLAAQAGVRYSLTHPFAYIEANLIGHLRVLEYIRTLKNFKHLVYASSSSVYGNSSNLPFSVEDRVDHPISLYAATKKSDELISYVYSHLYGIPQTGLRYFTVYGPWGRPDMALYIFTKAIEEGKPIRVFNGGNMSRDFTYIDDIVSGTIAALDLSPAISDALPYRNYNLGNQKPEKLLHLISLLENALGKRAEKLLEPMQPGDVRETYADIEASRRDLGFEPSTPLSLGIQRFVDWYRSYHC